MTGFELHHMLLVVLPFLGVSLIGVLFFIAHQCHRARRHEFSKAFLDKLSSEEFVGLLKSSAGRRSVERVLGTYRPAAEWITDAIRRAVLLVFVGLGCLAVYFLGDFEGRPIFLGVGALSVCGAIGYLVAAALTRGRARREDETA